MQEAAQPFAAMNGVLNPSLLSALQSMNYQHMTPVQSKVLNELPSWRNDCLVQAKTGTGKTIAFLLPSLHTLIQNQNSRTPGQVAILIVTPTRELAQQIVKECNQLTSQLRKPFECHLAVGGTARASAFSRFMEQDPAILIATPGRLKDYLSETRAARKFSEIQTLILDEADTMLESGFLADVQRILDELPPKSVGWQGMCFSATVPPRVRDVVNIILRPGYQSISTIDEGEAPTVDRVPQYSLIIPSVASTFKVLASLLRRESETSSKIIVFGVTANLVALYADLFTQGLSQLKVSEMHSRLSQSVRTRTTEEFKAAKYGVMFASDVVGRGMDFPNIDLVIQVGLPSSADQYIHRVGRTARAGNSGRAIIVLTTQEAFFPRAHRRLPIQPYPESDQILQSADSFDQQITNIMHNIDDIVKQRAYSSFIGFFAGSGLMKQVQLDKPGLVRLANDFAIQGMACPEPPPMEKKTVGKMGLKGVPGFNYATSDSPQKQSKPGNGGNNQARQNGPAKSTGHPAGVNKPAAGGRGHRGPRPKV